MLPRRGSTEEHYNHVYVAVHYNEPVKVMVFPNQSPFTISSSAGLLFSYPSNNTHQFLGEGIAELVHKINHS